MVRMRTAGVGASIVALAWACGGNGGTSFEDGGSGSDGSGGPADASTEPPVFGDSGTTSDTGTPVDSGDGCCPANAQYIYITGQGAQLWSFWPPTFTFKLVGTLSCTTAPTHMTVDRSGTAWVVGNGNVYQTSTLTAKCSVLPTWKPQVDWTDFALSFTGLACGDTTLYMLADWNGELGKFDTAKGTITKIGMPSVAGFIGDMTTNGDGTLYFLNDAPTLHLYDIDPATANVKKTYTIPNASGGGNQALAYFGGRFYAFENSVVYEYDPVANTTKNIGTAPISVTGAGQSTCVPSAPTDAGPPPVN